MGKHNHILLPNGDTIREDELYHWKYIRREKVNGKWRYWYDDDKDEQAVLDELNGLASQITGRYRQKVTKELEGLYKYEYYPAEASTNSITSYADRKGMTQRLKETIAEQKRMARDDKAKEFDRKTARTAKIAEIWVNDNLGTLFRNGERTTLKDAETRAKKYYPGLWD